jgi:MFS family permease
VNRWRLYALALLINFAATIALVFTRSVSDIILIRSLGGLGLAFFWPSAEILVLDSAPREKRVKEMGLYSVSWGSAFLIGPLLGGLIIQNFGFFDLFLLSSVLIMLAFLQTVFLAVPANKIKEYPTIHVSEGFHVMRGLVPWYVMIAAYGAIFSIVTTILPGYANSVGVNALLIGVIFTAFGLSRVVTFATIDHYLHFEEKKVLLSVSLLIGCSCLALGFYPNFNSFLFLAVLLGASFAVMFPLTIGLISRHFRDEQVGAAVGSYESVYGVGSALGPILAGTVAVMSEAKFSFLTASLFAILMMIIVAGKTYSES